MKSVGQKLVFRQYLSLLPVNILASRLMNYDAKKLTDFSLVRILIMANLFKWESLREIEEGIRSKNRFNEIWGLHQLLTLKLLIDLLI